MRSIQLTFGDHKGKTLEEIPEDYLKWLAKPVYSGKFYKSRHDNELTWRVPFHVKMEARKLLEKRGYKLVGERWEM